MTLPGQRYLPEDGRLVVPLGDWTLRAECVAPSRAVLRVDDARVAAVLVQPGASERARRQADALASDLVDLLIARRWAPLPTPSELHDALEVARARLQARAEAEGPPPPRSVAERAARWFRGRDDGAARVSILVARLGPDTADARFVLLGDHAVTAGNDARPLLDGASRSRLAEAAFRPDGVPGEVYVGTTGTLSDAFALRSADGTSGLALVRARAAVAVARLGTDADAPEDPPAYPAERALAAPALPSRRAPVYDDPAWALEDARQAPRRARGNVSRWLDPKDP